MPASWKTVRVFISSTFRDMHSERDHLVKHVFPALREKLEKYRIHLVDIDLRWGVTAEQADNDQALDLCLQQIDECRPLFIGILGERYGWVPEQPPNLEKAEYGWIQGMTGKSITELEIMHGVLNDQEMRGRVFFYFRDGSFIENVPPHKRGEMLSENDDSGQKLQALKQTIRDAQLPLFAGYPCRYRGLRINWGLVRSELNPADQQALEEIARDGIVDPQEYASLAPNLQQFVEQHGHVYLEGLDEFGDRVHQQLWAAIKAEHDLPQTPPTASLAASDPLAAEAGYHEQFMESRLRVYVGRLRDRQDLARFADGDDLVACLVTGPPGSGKSALLARFLSDYRDTHQQVLVIPHFVGASPGSSSLPHLLRRFCGVLRERFGFALEIPDKDDELPTTFRTFVTLVPAEQRVLLVIDALNQLDESHQARNLHWLPAELPAHVKLVTSCITPSSPDRAAEAILGAFGRRKYYAVEVHPLTKGERRQIIHEVPSLSAKSLDPTQVGLLLSNPATTNPLFLLVALEELRGFGSYELLDARIAGLPRADAGTEPEWQDWLAEARTAAGELADDEQRSKRLTRLQQIEQFFKQVSPVADTLTVLFTQVIERLEIEFGEELVRAVFTLLASARRGLSERELQELASSVEQAGNLFPVLRQLRPYLLSRGDLRDFYHGSLPHAVHRHYWPSPELQQAAHLRLADYFESQKTDSRRIDELPWQLCEARLWQRLSDLLADLPFFAVLWEAGQFDLKAYWSQLEAGSPLRMVDAYRPVLDDPSQLEGSVCNLISILLDDTGHPTAALQLREHLVENYRKTGDRDNLQATLGNQALILSDRGDLDGAMTLHKQQEQICRELGNVNGLAISLVNQASVLAEMHELDAAVSRAEESYNIATQHGLTALAQQIKPILDWVRQAAGKG